MSRWYKLDENNKPILAESFNEYIDWERNNSRTVAREDIGDATVSTVFLGLDHSFNGVTPVLWETMIFGGKHDQYQERYKSHYDAIIGHQRAINLVNESLCGAQEN